MSPSFGLANSCCAGVHRLEFFRTPLNLACLRIPLRQDERLGLLYDSKPSHVPSFEQPKLGPEAPSISLASHVGPRSPIPMQTRCMTDALMELSMHSLAFTDEAGSTSSVAFRIYGCHKLPNFKPPPPPSMLLLSLSTFLSITLHTSSYNTNSVTTSSLPQNLYPSTRLSISPFPLNLLSPHTLSSHANSRHAFPCSKPSIAHTTHPLDNTIHPQSHHVEHKQHNLGRYPRARTTGRSHSRRIAMASHPDCPHRTGTSHCARFLRPPSQARVLVHPPVIILVEPIYSRP